ncbi:MAG TPA: DNA-processing protein DprA [Acidimicrobiales bacterium]|nr:DNA-processing protein DprA [Acidimicrobiales bacterium]
MLRRLSPGQAGYPTPLAAISSPPDPLWLRGAEPKWPAVAVVGTRRPDAEGRRVASVIATTLAARGIAVVSGLAPGIDTAAHRAALRAGGRTWAVVGCGADMAESVEDPDLPEDMVGAGGILAELPPGQPASARALVARDRIQTALSAATVVVQTDLASGTMHTARFALVQGRPLAVVAPGAGPRWAGNAALVDPAGCDPAALHARGEAGRLVQARRPVADVVLDGGDVAPLLARLGL